ncbi:MAG: hypothetical protein IAC23_05315 [Bacteroidetes bacterium]|uniref:Secreted protein n=1 Tax=Candidatus Cryptobacteroides merdavium TaxID=2840769 RepID=A0A9D9HCQ8_9BACT|nr:hypothetical protein [Candidatus Cryptobacteroides merdavium]
MKMIKHTATTAVILSLILLAASPSASARKAKGAMESLEEVSKVMKKTAWKEKFFYRRNAARADMERRNHIFHQLEPDFTVSDTLIYILKVQINCSIRHGAYTGFMRPLQTKL